MKTERQTRLENELSFFSASDLSRPMYDLGEEVISHLVSEAGYGSAKSYLNDGHGWSETLASTIEDLVNSIFTLDGVTYDSRSEMLGSLKELQA
jgi:hypothetical protein